MKKLIVPIIFILLFSFIVSADVTLNFLTATQISTTSTNNTITYNGNLNNTHLIYGKHNDTARTIQLSNNLDNGTLTGFSSFCDNVLKGTGNNILIYKLPNNAKICLTGTSGTGYIYSSTGTNYTSSDGYNFFGITSNNGTYYHYTNGGNPLLLSKKLTETGTGYPALNCYTHLSNVFLNNFGINLTLNGGLNQTYTSGTIIQHNYTTFYFKVGSRWFYFEETGSNDCTQIANTLNEATLTLPDVSYNNRKIIINDKLFINGKDTNQLYTYNSAEVDIYSNLVCNNDNTNCYNQSGVCLPNNELYPGINSSNYLCYNVSLLGNDLYCYTGTGLIDDGLNYCPGGCLNTELTNIYDVTYTTGTCYNSSTCNNDCVVEGLTYSDTPTSYKECGFYDDDLCLDWSFSIPCSDGEYSLNGFCYTLNTSGYEYYGLTSFSSTPNLEIATSYDLNTYPKSANYQFPENIGLIGVDYASNPSSFYISKICDYTSTNLVNEPTYRNINSSYTWNVPGYTNGDVKIKIMLSGNGTGSLKGYDSNNLLVYEYNITINETYGVCLYDNDSLLGCESVAYTDINNIELTIKTVRPQTKQLNSARLIINKNNGGYQDIYTGVFNPLTIPSLTLSKLTFYSNNATVQSMIVYNEAQLNEPFKNTTWTIINNGEIQYQHTCSYITVGCRTLRSYYKDDLTEGNWNTQDWTICINRLGGTTITSDSGFFNIFTPTQKLIYSFIISFIVLMFFVIFGYTRNSETEQKGFLFVGIFFAIGLLLLFAILKWLPIWILIIAGIIASLGVGVFFMRKSQGV